MSINIILDNNNQNVCFPGQTIAGRVECNFNKEKTLQAIRIRFSGKAHVEWDETESSTDSSTGKSESRTVTYTADEEYMNAEYNLVQGGDNFSLSAGQHVYPFSYILPAQVPSSFQGTYGAVKYYITATVDRPWKFDYEAKCLLALISPLDLNFIPRLKEPVAVSDEKTVCSCWCNDSGALTFNVSLPVGGYVPGQPINVGSYIQNLTNVSVQKVKYEVMENIEYVTKFPSTNHQYEQNTLVSCHEGGIGAHGEKSWTSALIIPAERTYSNLLSCSIINISYKLIAEAVIPCPHTNLKLEIPIKIGHVALVGVDTSLPGPPTSPPIVYDPEVPPYVQNGGDSNSPSYGSTYPTLPIGSSYASYEKQNLHSAPAGGQYSPSVGAPLGWVSEPPRDILASAPPAYEDNSPEKKEKM